MNLKKNAEMELEITGMTSEGNGVGRYNGFAVFIPMTAVGDIVIAHITKVNKTYAYAVVKEIVRPSPEREQNSCPVFQTCGGCTYRHLSYRAELRLKQQLVEQNMKKIAHAEILCEDILSAGPERYRNKAQYPVRMDSHGKTAAGFFAKRSHRVIACDDCLLEPEIFGKIVRVTLALIDQYRLTPYCEETGTGEVRHIFLRRGESSGEIMFCLVVTALHGSTGTQAKQVCLAVAQQFAQIVSCVLNEKKERDNVILGTKEQVVCGKSTIQDELCGLTFHISPRSFYQVNRTGAQLLYQAAAEFAGLTGNEILLDLYCGAGTIGLSMAGWAKAVIGVEVIPEAVENARVNAQVNNIGNATFLCADAGQAAARLAEQGTHPDVVVVDPPRKGCDKTVLDAVEQMAPQRIVMISCNSATAARDVAVLEQKGYRAVRMKACDLFPRTAHVECVILLQKENL